MQWVVDQLKETVGIAMAFDYSTVRMTTEEAAQLMFRIEALQDAAKLVVHQFDEIDDDKWATTGMKQAIERLRTVVELGEGCDE